MPDPEDEAEDDPFEIAARQLRERIESKREAHEEERTTEQFQVEIRALETLTEDFVSALRLAWTAFTRDPRHDEWMLHRFTDDLLESAIAAGLLAQEGVFNVGRRELRYVLEAATKYVYVDQQLPAATPLADRVALLVDTTRVPRSSVEPVQDLTFRLVEAKPFRNAVTSAFGAMSGYTHASTRQLDERLRRASRGEWSGFESAATLRSFNRLLFSTYDVVLTLIFEGIGPAFTRDLFEQALAGNDKWRYHKGRFVREVRAQLGG